MTTLEHLSNAELVQELYQCKNPTWSLNESIKRQELQREILRRLNEPWRRNNKNLVELSEVKYSEGKLYLSLWRSGLAFHTSLNINNQEGQKFYEQFWKLKKKNEPWRKQKE